MLAGVWTWVRLPPAPLFFHPPWKNVVKSTFFIFIFGIPWYSFAEKADPKTDPLFEEGLSYLKINIICKSFSDIVLGLLGYVSINVHGRF